MGHEPDEIAAAAAYNQMAVLRKVMIPWQILDAV